MLPSQRPAPPFFVRHARSPSMASPMDSCTCDKTHKDVGFSTSGLAGPPPHPMPLDRDVLVAALWCHFQLSLLACEAACSAALPLNTQPRRCSATVTAISCVYSADVYMSEHTGSACMSYVNYTRGERASTQQSAQKNFNSLLTLCYILVSR